MSVDPSILLGVHPIQLPTPADPMEQASRSLALRGLLGQQDLQGLQIQQARRNAADEEAVSGAYRQSAGDPTVLRQLLYGAGQHKAVSELDKNLLDTAVKKATLEHTQAQTGEISAGTIAAGLAALSKGGGSDASVGQVVDLLAPTLGAVHGDSLRATLMAMAPADRVSYMVQHAVQHKNGQEALRLLSPEAHLSDSGGAITPVSTSTLPGAPPPGSVIPGAIVTPKTQTPDSVATDKRIASEGALNRGAAATQGTLNRANHLTIAGLDANGHPLNAVAPGEKIDLTTVSPVDLEAAHRYNADGTLPPNMGRGQQGMAESKRIRSISAALSEAAGIDPADVRANQLAFKGGGQALSQLIKREAQVGANVRNFDFNAGQVLDLSQKVDRSGIPLVNAWLNAGRRSVSGNPDLSAFDTAVKTTVNEFAQIVSGTTAGATTQGEKEKAEKLLSAQQTPEQIMAVINQMRIESQNRMKSFADQKKQTLSGLRPGAWRPPAPTMPAGSATPVVAPQPAATPGVRFLGFEG